ncbi:MAG: malto-oligosyltrehalose trehalohydrolase [Actinomycetota bacterium]|nr:malto-oligosyltrehalose trehalohydrolase [Actinomycetota bacterium]
MPLEPGRHGWYRVRTEARHGDAYAFRLDGGEPRPDPAARWLPDGVHGRARIFDAATLAWSASERTWRAPALSAGAVYELHVGTFTPEGTFAAAAEHLDALGELGVTHVEVMPVNGFNGTAGWGYDGVAWYAVHEPYGGPTAFAHFVDACHAAGLAVVLDVVYNHLGPSGNYLPDFGPYLTDRYRTPWGEGLNLDGPDSDPVRSFIVGNAVHWLDTFHVDGLRLDAVHGLVDTSALPILSQLSDTVAALAARRGRPLQLIAESDRCDPLTIRPRTSGGTGLDALWADDLHHAIHTAVTGEHDGYYVDYAGLPDVAAAYRQGFLYDGRYSVYRRRTVGAPLGDLSAHRLVTCVQNHDQVGNRAAGERLVALVGDELARVAAVLLCAAPSVPLLFMGEEHGETAPFQFFTSHPEPELAEAVRRGRREEFASFASFGESADVPDPQDPATVDRSRIDWARADSERGRAWRDLWRRLLALRRSEPALGNGRRDLVEVLTVDGEVLALVRRDDGGSAVLVVANLSGDERVLALPDGRWRRLLDTGAARPQGDRDLVVTPRSASLWAPE